MAGALYLDASAVLRATIEAGLSPDVEARLQAADVLLTSRLSPVECARAILRLRLLAQVPEERVAEAERDIDALFSRCDLWELSPTVCELAGRVAPRKNVRALDALHLATYLTARRRLEGLELLTTDDRLRDAASTV